MIRRRGRWTKEKTPSTLYQSDHRDVEREEDRVGATTSQSDVILGS